ncbi:MAG: ATP-dependent DNA helicase [Caulobacteraceae bacterium]
MTQSFDIQELEKFFLAILEKYHEWASMLQKWYLKRDRSIRAADFPYSEYRKNQRKLAVAVYKTIEGNKRIYVQAPTGTGKTMSALFPSVKAIGEGKAEKLFYLTAKTITRQVALDAFERMKAIGLEFKVIVLTAKDKICFKDEKNCNPEYCEYAKGYFDKINNALARVFEAEDIITREAVERYAREYGVCPFELSLDLSYFMDCIICDYNYVFDPRANLRRFFEDKENSFVLLIDEAHNLVDRAREMFSSELWKRAFLEAKRYMKTEAPSISKTAGKINSLLLELKKNAQDKNCCIKEDDIKDLYPLLKKFVSLSDEWLPANQKSERYGEILDLYFQVLAFLRISELYDERYTIYLELQKNDVMLKLFCLDPSKLLQEITDRMGASVFFSATLTPLHYFKDILGGSEGDYTVRFPSPFEREKLFLAIAENVSTKYSDREKSISDVVEYINTVAGAKKGNYLICFPSYKYMRDTYEMFSSQHPGARVIIQQPSMQEEEKEMFLQCFEPDSRDTVIGFAVMGGMFSEGIDLVGDRLLGAVVVGVGLPQLCFERNIIMDYYRDKKDKGFEYAYMYPGMNKVLQAAGRVIRSENDKGVVLLVDERFSSNRYAGMFPEEWKHNIRVNSPLELNRKLTGFWKGK